MLSADAKDPQATGLRRIPIDDLDRCPSRLPDAYAGRAFELDLPAGSFDGNARSGFGSAYPVRAVRAQHIGEDRDRVVALEAYEGRRLGQLLAEGVLDSCAEGAEVLGQVAQERDRLRCRRSATSSRTAAGASAHMSSSMTVPPRGARYCQS